ncbi:MAG: hypothetical protein II970_04675 [Paludibacteraceae bacterium]|nr:hypothetical protein [Paludibacteraceae bacterium]
MRIKITYRLWALVVLYAFCRMLVVKQFHHHEAHHAHELLCVVDHLPLGECGHSHDSFIAYDSDGDDCAICKFTIAKFFQPKYIVSVLPATQSSVLQDADLHFLQGTFRAACLGRAPPVPLFYG